MTAEQRESGKEEQQQGVDGHMGEIEGGQKRQAEGGGDEDGWLEIASSINKMAKGAFSGAVSTVSRCWANILDEESEEEIFQQVEPEANDGEDAWEHLDGYEVEGGLEMQPGLTPHAV